MRRIGFPLCMLAAAVAAVAWAGGQNAAPATEDQSVRATAAAYSEALNKGDLAGVLATWATDADYMDDAGTTYKGREALGKLFKPHMDGFKAGKVALKLDSVRLLKPDVALTDGTIDFTPTDGAMDRNRFSAVWAKVNGQWLIASARDLPDLDNPAADHSLQQLAWMQGNWIAEDRGTKVALDVRSLLSGKYQQFTFSIDGPKDKLQVIMLAGWDPGEGGVHSWTFDSRGGFGEGTWARSGAAWEANTTGLLPTGQQASARVTLKPNGTDAFTWFSTEREVDGQPIADHELKYTRVTPPR